MASGQGSGEFLAALNKLAGTTGAGEQYAANVYAYGKDRGVNTLRALNDKAGTVGQGLNAVCNVIAGTHGMEAQQALAIKAGAPIA